VVVVTLMLMFVHLVDVSMIFSSVTTRQCSERLQIAFLLIMVVLMMMMMCVLVDVSMFFSSVTTRQ
jgi:hypothetical protein